MVYCLPNSFCTGISLMLKLMEASKVRIGQYARSGRKSGTPGATQLHAGRPAWCPGGKF